MERYGTLLFLLFSSFLDIRKREISIPDHIAFRTWQEWYTASEPEEQ